MNANQTLAYALALHRSKRDPERPVTRSQQDRAKLVGEVQVHRSTPGVEAAMELAFNHLTRSRMAAAEIDDLEEEVANLKRQIDATPNQELKRQIGKRPIKDEAKPEIPEGANATERARLKAKEQARNVASWLDARTDLQKRYAEEAAVRMQTYLRAKASLRACQQKLVSLRAEVNTQPALTERRLIALCGSRPAARSAIFLLLVEGSIEVNGSTAAGHPTYGPREPFTFRRPGGKGRGPSPLASQIATLQPGQAIQLPRAPGQVLQRTPPSWLRRKFPKREYKLTRRPHTITRIK